MDEKKRLDAIQALERQINGLPIGYISKKNINGKARYYHQWTEAGKNAAGICGMESWNRSKSKLRSGDPCRRS